MTVASKLVFRVGMSLDEIDREIVANSDAAMIAVESGQTVEPRRTIGFEDWAAFFRSMTANRIAILEYIAEQEIVASTRALSAALGRDYAAVHADVAALVRIGLLERGPDLVQVRQSRIRIADRRIAHYLTDSTTGI